MSYCACNKNNCILKNNTVYQSYKAKKAIKEHIPDEICECCVNKKAAFKFRESSFLKIDRPKVDILLNESKCNLVKKLIRLDLFVDELSSINQVLVKDELELQKAFDREVVNNLKLKEILNKNFVLLKENKQQIDKLNNTENELRNENKKLKKRIKQLEKLIVQSDNEEIDDEIEEEIDDEIEEEEEDGIDVLLKYQKIKDYLVKNDISLSRLCFRNTKYDKKKIFNKFINLKIRRLNTAHPVVDKPLENDDEFINLLLS